MRSAVFLDRDGTLMRDVDYLVRLDQIALFPWTVDALRLLTRAGFLTVVVTNQSGVARGMITAEFVRTAHDELNRLLARGGAHLDALYFCPHHPEKGSGPYRASCRCRKPAPGLLEDAARDLSIDLTQSWMVGDRWIDVAAGNAAGVRSILVTSGFGGSLHAPPPAGATVDAILNNLMEAVGWILPRSTSR